MSGRNGKRLEPSVQAACPSIEGTTIPGGANLDTAMEGRSYSQNSTPVAHSDVPHANRWGTIQRARGRPNRAQPEDAP
jgi:hypothetical protein